MWPVMKALLEKARTIHRTAVFWSFAGTGIRFSGLVIVLPIVLRALDPGELGVWYLFLSLGTCGALLDSGFGPATTRAVAYLWAGARRISAADFHEDGKSHAAQTIDLVKLKDLQATLRVLYQGVALAVLLALGFLGTWWIFCVAKAGDEVENLSWIWAFYLLGLVFLTCQTVWKFFLNGLNEVVAQNRIFALALSFNYITVVLFLLQGFGLWAMVAGNLLQGIMVMALSKRSVRRVLPELSAKPLGRFQSRLLKELWPQAWRMGVTFVGVSLTLSAGPLVLSWSGDLAIVASYGLSAQIALTLVQIASVPFVVKLPLFSRYFVQAEHTKVRALFLQRWFMYWALIVLGVTSFWWLRYPLLQDVVKSETSLLPSFQLLILFLFFALEGNQGLMRDFLASRNDNSFMWIIAVSGCMVMTMAAVTSQWGVEAVVLSQLCVSLCLVNWWITCKALRSCQVLGSSLRYTSAQS